MAFLGMRGTGSWATNQRPKNWREMILYLYPNGNAPLTAILSMMKTDMVNDPEYNWWTQTLSTQSGTVTGIYTDAGLSIAYASGGVSGDTLYVKMSAADIGEVRIGHQVLLRDASDLTVDVNVKVVDRTVNGASSYLQVKLLEDDDNSTSNDLSDADTFLITGNINSEGANMPDAVSYDPVQWYNYTQIFRTPLKISRTAEKTKLRTNPQAYQKLKKDALQMHSVEMEKAFIWGVPSNGTGTNGLPERTTLGLVGAIRGGYTGHGGTAGTVSDYPTDTSYSGKSWLQGGEDWIDTQLEIMFRYGNTEKTALCGSGALSAINKLVKTGGDFSFEASTNVYGINVRRWVTPLGTINLITHPLFSQVATNRYSMVIFEPENIVYRPLTDSDTMFYDDDLKKNTGWTREDGRSEEWLTEAGLEYHHPVGWGYLTGLGTDNSV